MSIFSFMILAGHTLRSAHNAAAGAWIFMSMVGHCSSRHITAGH